MHLLKLDTWSCDFLLSYFIYFIEKRYEFFLYIGIEIEFYIDAQNQDFASHKSIEDKIDIFVEQLRDKKIEVKKEKGKYQYEIALPFCKLSKNFYLYIEQHKLLLQTLASENNLEINFSGKPYANDYGSAMHYHISLHDIKTCTNLYSYHSEIHDNEILMHSIAGILENIKHSIYFIIGNSESEYHRFQKGFMAPTHISWGGNNRTALLRIPECCNANRRIEFRLPSPQSNIKHVLLFIASSLIYGIEKKLQPLERLYGNAYDEQYNLKPIAHSLSIAKGEDSFFDMIKEIFIFTLLY